MPSANGAASGGSTVPLVINGADVNLTDTFDVFGPGVGKVVHKSSNAGVSHALDAVQAGADALDSWRQTTPGQRRDIFLKAADIIDRRADELKNYLIEETAGDDAWASFNLHLAKECVLGVAGRVMAVEGRIPAPENPTSAALIVKEPYGVVLALAPW